MKNFSKSLLAVALLATGTGAANASINVATAPTGTAAEAFMQVYDSLNGKTFDLDLGVTVATLIANKTNSVNFSVDLSTDTNWSSFLTGFSSANTIFGVVGGNGTKSVFTSTNVNGNLNAGAGNATTLTNIGNNIKLAADRINAGQVANTAQNLSKLVLDTDTAGTGQWASTAGGSSILTNLYGAFGGANAALAYNDAVGGSLFTGSVAAALNLGQVTLVGNTLSITTTTSAVPLPAAVWMFGAGLMGVLRLNRRKSAAI